MFEFTFQWKTLLTEAEKHQPQPQEMSATTSSEAVSEAKPLTPTTEVNLEAIKQKEQNVPGTVAEVTTSPTMIDKSETEVPTEYPEKIAVVNEQSGSEEQETVGPSEKTAKVRTVNMKLFRQLFLA